MSQTHGLVGKDEKDLRSQKSYHTHTHTWNRCAFLAFVPSFPSPPPDLPEVAWPHGHFISEVEEGKGAKNSKESRANLPWAVEEAREFLLFVAVVHPKGYKAPLCLETPLMRIAFLFFFSHRHLLHDTTIQRQEDRKMTFLTHIFFPRWYELGCM